MVFVIFFTRLLSSTTHALIRASYDDQVDRPPLAVKKTKG